MANRLDARVNKLETASKSAVGVYVINISAETSEEEFERIIEQELGPDRERYSLIVGLRIFGGRPDAF